MIQIFKYSNMFQIYSNNFKIFKYASIIQISIKYSNIFQIFKYVSHIQI